MQVVESMRLGMTPTQATEDAMRRILRFIVGGTQLQGALVAIDSNGNHGAAATGWTFQYSLRKDGHPGDVEVFSVAPLPREELPTTRAHPATIATMLEQASKT